MPFDSIALAAEMRHFADASGVSLGVERVAGLSFSRTTYAGARFDSYAAAALAAPDPFIAHHAMRVAADFFVLPGFDIGGMFGVVRSGTSAAFSNGQTESMPQTTLLFAGGRAGYAVETDEGLYFWPRAGLYYARAAASGAGVDLRDERWTLTLETALTLVPIEHISVSLIPALDLDVAHRSTSLGATDHPPKTSTFGLYAGIGAWF